MTNVLGSVLSYKEDTIVEILESRALQTPNEPAFGMLDADLGLSEITYSQLESRVAAWSFRLTALHIAYGNRCLLMFQQGIDFIVALLACQRIGAIAVPVNLPSRSKSVVRWENIALNCGANCILTDEASASQIAEAVASSEVLSSLPVYFETSAGAIPKLEHAQRFHELAFLQYTSGSTGSPKGVMVTHACLINNLKQMKRTYALHDRSVMLSWLPYYHDMGLILGILLGVYTGFKVILMKPVDFMQKPLGWLDAISRYQATHTAAPNFAYELAAERLDKLAGNEGDHLSLRSLQKAFCGAEPIRINTMIRFNRSGNRFGLRNNVLSPGYGLAEASLAVSVYRTEQPASWLKVDRPSLQGSSVVLLDRGTIDQMDELIDESDNEETYLVGNGYALDEHELSIRHPETGGELGEWEIGEVCFSGPSVTKGYWDGTEETNASFVRNSKDGSLYLKTGDLGFQDDHGELYVTGRIKDLIIIRGMNLYPQDIERTVCQSDPDLRTDGAAAFSIVRDGEEKLVVIAELNRNAVRNPPCNRLARNIQREVLNVHGVPVDTILFVPPMHVPRTTSGKIQRGKAKLMFMNDEWSKTLGKVSMGQIESTRFGKTIVAGQPISKAAIAQFITLKLAEQLGISPEQVEDDVPFTELGVNSLMSLLVRDSIEEMLCISLSATALFNYNTVQSMSDYLLALSQQGSDIGVAGARDIREPDSGVGALPELDAMSEDELLNELRKELGGVANANGRE